VESYQPLYLKYRPQALADLVGQTAVTQTLKNAITHDRINHAYLFTGPRGCGKTSSARILAKSLNCLTGTTHTPCMTCTSCVEIKQGISPSVFEIDAASNNSVDDARLLIERAPLVAQGGKYKIYIIDECHMLTKEAFNALLKTIEEPPPRVIFILATTEEHKVPPTIVSRCQRLMFRLVNQPDLVAHLRNIASIEKIEIEDSALELLARRSGGGLRDALGLLDQASLLSAPGQPVSATSLLQLLGAINEDVLLKISAGVAEKNGKEVLESAHTLMMEGREPALLALELAKHFLNLAKANYLQSGKNAEQEAQALILGSNGYIVGLLEQAPRFERVELAQIVEQLDKLEQTCKRSSQPAMNLEIGLVALCHRNDILQLTQLESRVAQLEAELCAPQSGRPMAPTAARAPQAVAPARPAPAPAPTSVSPAAQPPQLPAPTAVSPPPPTPAPVATPPAATVEQAPEAPVAAATALSAPAAEPASTQAPTASATAPAANVAPEPVSEAPRQNENTAAPTPVVSALPITPPPRQDASADASFASAIELEEFWSNLLDELQKRHLPTFACVSSQSFPVAMETDDITIGVRADHLLKIIESKVEHIKAASAAVKGRPMHVRVKVVNQGGSTARPKAGSAAPSPAPAPAQSPAPSAAVAPSAAPKSRMGGSDESAAEDERSSPQADDTAQAAPARQAQPVPGDGERAPSLAGDAYKIFDGPGSRRISPP
jgi:DNA polymerase-3 subunit gamma/tau